MVGVSHHGTYLHGAKPGMSEPVSQHSLWCDGLLGLLGHRRSLCTAPQSEARMVPHEPQAKGRLRIDDEGGKALPHDRHEKQWQATKSLVALHQTGGGTPPNRRWYYLRFSLELQQAPPGTTASISPSYSKYFAACHLIADECSPNDIQAPRIQTREACRYGKPPSYTKLNNVAFKA